MTNRIAVAFGLLSAIAVFSIGFVSLQGETTANTVQPQSLVQEKLEPHQVPPPDCDPVNDPSSCRSS